MLLLRRDNANERSVYERNGARRVLSCFFPAILISFRSFRYVIIATIQKRRYVRRYLTRHVNQRVWKAIPESTKRKEEEGRALNETHARSLLGSTESLQSLCKSLRVSIASLFLRERPRESFIRVSEIRRCLSSREIRIVFD